MAMHYKKCTLFIQSDYPFFIIHVNIDFYMTHSKVLKSLTRNKNEWECDVNLQFWKCHHAFICMDFVFEDYKIMVTCLYYTMILCT